MFNWRLIRLTLLSLACALCLCVLVLLPDLFELLPSRIRTYWPLGLALTGAMAHALVRGMAAAQAQRRRSGEWATVGLKRLERFSDWALEGGLAGALGLLCVGLLLGWIPHYLTWPWSRDPE